MSKRKYKVGQRYEVNCDDRKGNIIEITDVDSQYAYYRTIKRQRGIMDVFHFFEQGSNFEKSLKPLKNESIVIYRKGQEVIALDKTTGYKAVAKCCPDDEFDFNVGAKLAFERLLGVEQPKEGDGFCHEFKAGKTYVFRKAILKKYLHEKDSGWSNECDGHVVKVRSKRMGIIDVYDIRPEWCEELDIAIGDMVEVVNTGSTYSTFKHWKGLKGYEQNFVCNKSPIKNKAYKCLNIDNHGGTLEKRLVALIQDTDTTQVFIIGVKGIKKA